MNACGLNSRSEDKTLSAPDILTLRVFDPCKKSCEFLLALLSRDNPLLAQNLNYERVRIDRVAGKTLRRAKYVITQFNRIIINFLNTFIIRSNHATNTFSFMICL